MASCWAGDIEQPWRAAITSSPAKIPARLSLTLRSPDPLEPRATEGSRKGRGHVEVWLPIPSSLEAEDSKHGMARSDSAEFWGWRLRCYPFEELPCFHLPAPQVLTQDRRLQVVRNLLDPNRLTVPP